MVLETGRDVEQRERNVPQREVVLERVNDVGVALQRDRVTVHHDCLQLVVDLQCFGQQASAQVAHQVPADVEHLKVLIASQSVDEVVNVVLEFVLGDVKLGQHEVVLLYEVHERIHDGADVLELHALEAFDQVKRFDRWILADGGEYRGHLGIEI